MRNSITEIKYRGFIIRKNGSTFDLFEELSSGRESFHNVFETPDEAMNFVDYKLDEFL